MLLVITQNNLSGSTIKAHSSLFFTVSQPNDFYNSRNVEPEGIFLLKISLNTFDGRDRSVSCNKQEIKLMEPFKSYRNNGTFEELSFLARLQFALDKKKRIKRDEEIQLNAQRLSISGDVRDVVWLSQSRTRSDTHLYSRIPNTLILFFF